MPELYDLCFAAFFAGCGRQKIVTDDNGFRCGVFFHERKHIPENLHRRRFVIIPVHFCNLKLRMPGKFFFYGEHTERNFVVMCIRQDYSSGYDRFCSTGVINNRKNQLLEKHFYDLFYSKYHYRSSRFILSILSGYYKSIPDEV